MKVLTKFNIRNKDVESRISKDDRMSLIKQCQRALLHKLDNWQGLHLSPSQNIRGLLGII